VNPEAGDVRCYAVRRVNPFEGVLQIVETHDARAYSPNGTIWQIQVLTQRPDHTWRSFSHVLPIEQFFNFGLWDAKGGLQKIPANPVMDIGGMTRAAEALTSELHRLGGQLPFRLSDRYECWSTDYQGNPIALLATTEDPQRMPDIRAARWQATRVSEHGFVSPSLVALGIPADGDLGPRQHAEHLERQVRQSGQQKAWFERSESGTGRRIDPPNPAAPLPASAFPPLGLKTDWKDQQTRDLATDYLAWQAPRLLMLQDIDDRQRRWLEPEACRQAVELAAAYRLIPHVIDHRRIEAARVEARLRRAAIKG
jgi:hypothetical protein